MTTNVVVMIGCFIGVTAIIILNSGGVSCCCCGRGGSVHGVDCIVVVIVIRVGVVVCCNESGVHMMIMLLIAKFSMTSIGYDVKQKNDENNTQLFSYSSKSIMVEKLNLATQELHFYDK